MIPPNASSSPIRHWKAKLSPFVLHLLALVCAILSVAVICPSSRCFMGTRASSVQWVYKHEGIMTVEEHAVVSLLSPPGDHCYWLLRVVRSMDPF